MNWFSSGRVDTFRFVRVRWGTWTETEELEGIIGGTLCYPVAVLLMGKDVALFFYVLPFLMSTACGTAIAFLLIEFMRRIGLFSYLKRLLDAQ